MILYHGSNGVVSKLKLFQRNRLSQNALFCILLSQEKKGWILYQITSGYYKGEDYESYSWANGQ